MVHCLRRCALISLCSTTLRSFDPNLEVTDHDVTQRRFGGLGEWYGGVVFVLSAVGAGVIGNGAYDGLSSLLRASLQRRVGKRRARAGRQTTAEIVDALREFDWDCYWTIDSEQGFVSLEDEEIAVVSCANGVVEFRTA